MSDPNGLKKSLIGAAAAIVVGLVFQTGALLWWGGKIDARVTGCERNLDQVAQRVHTLEVMRHE